MSFSENTADKHFVLLHKMVNGKVYFGERKSRDMK